MHSLQLMASTQQRPLAPTTVFCLQDFHQIALSDEQAISKFHRDVNKDETVRVSPWSSGERVVEFILAMSIPKSVQSFIGG
jgi:hypothetical protein